MTVAARSAEEHPARNEPRARRWRPRVLLGVVVLLWAGLMFPLAFWGLPTAHNDDLLFGGTAPWPADRYGLGQALAERQSRRAGADTDLNPLAERERVVDLTADEAARAEILRRYRLFSGQPDEMITLMALQRMRPRAGDFDPQMYQYGGAYIYMVGAVLGGARLVGIIPRGADAGFYLEHPDVFGRFYVVARCLSLVFAALALVAVYHLGQRAGGATTGWLALALAAGAPVFITQALEAKPHLPSACLILWAILSALDYRATGRTRDALKMGAQAGFACGLVLTGVVAALLWPALLLARPGHARRAALRDLGLAAAVAAAVYAATNPFLVRNLLFARGA
ncbi:MAG: glycosyltransferase family 39 protein, partial [Planctomycetota bacterium]